MFWLSLQRLKQKVVKLDFDPSGNGSSEYFRGVVEYAHKDPCWTPEKYGIKTSDIDLAFKIRLNSELMSQLSRTKSISTEKLFTARTQQLQIQFPMYDWTAEPLQEWVKAQLQALNIQIRLDDPSTCFEIPKIDVGPIREQQNPWCTAMVAADLLSQNVGAFVSASDLMLRYRLQRYEEGQRILPEVGVDQPLFAPSGVPSIAEVVESGREGLCLESNFRSGVVSGRHSSFIIRDFFQESSSGVVSAKIISEMKGVFGGLKADQNSLMAPYHPLIIEDIASQSCFPRVHAEKFEIVDKRPRALDLRNHQTLEVIDEMDKVLSARKILGVGISKDSIGSGLNIDSTNGHAISIVGRRFNHATAKCEYLVRNSTGENWGTGGYKYVPRTILVPSISQIVYLK